MRTPISPWPNSVSVVYCTSILIRFAFHRRWSRLFYPWKFGPAFSSPAFSASPPRIIFHRVAPQDSSWDSDRQTVRRTGSSRKVPALAHLSSLLLMASEWELRRCRALAQSVVIHGLQPSSASACDVAICETTAHLRTASFALNLKDVLLKISTVSNVDVASSPLAPFGGIDWNLHKLTKKPSCCR